jgi:hypothetical protein
LGAREEGAGGPAMGPKRGAACAVGSAGTAHGGGGKGGRGGGWAGAKGEGGGWAKMGKGGEREKEKVFLFPIFHFLYPLFLICLILQFTQPQIKKVHNPA